MDQMYALLAWTASDRRETDEDTVYGIRRRGEAVVSGNQFGQLCQHIYFGFVRSYRSYLQQSVNNYHYF